MRVTTTTCDECGKDISRLDSPRDEYMYALSSPKIPNFSNVRYATDFPPPINGEKHYCSHECLAKQFE